MKINPIKKAIIRACTDADFRSRLAADPRKALAEEGLIVPPDVQIVIHEPDENKMQVVLPGLPLAGAKDASRRPLTEVVADTPAGLKLEWREHLLLAEGRLDSATAPALRRELQRAFWDVDLDMAKVTFLSSAGLSALLAGQKHLNENDAKLRLFDVPEAVFSVIEMAGFAELFECVYRDNLDGLAFLPMYELH
jgi:anti-anti-sigma factor